MNDLTVISLIIISCGILGGYANFHRYEINHEFKWFNLRKSILIGVVSASTVPLFLQMVSSNLLIEAQDVNSKYLYLLGFV